VQAEQAAVSDGEEVVLPYSLAASGAISTEPSPFRVPTHVVGTKFHTIRAAAFFTHDKFPLFWIIKIKK
jgi:hypothetical protein